MKTVEKESTLIGHHEIQFPNAKLIPEIARLLEDGHTVTLRLRGNSMRPFLEDNRDEALFAYTSHPKVGDAVLAEICPHIYALHRIIRLDGDEITMRGDGNLQVERCRLSDVKGKAIGFYRKGRTKLDSTDGFKWRIYSYIWTRLFPLRRYLLFMLYPHVPRRIKKSFKS